MIKDRHSQGKERLEDVRERIKALCEPVEPPRDTAAYIRYFLATMGNMPPASGLHCTGLTSSFIRAYANIANEMAQAGYSEERIADDKG